MCDTLQGTVIKQRYFICILYIIFRNFSHQFDVFSTVHHSIGLFLQPIVMHNSITICMSHYFPRHVSGLDMPILRKNNCTNTASGILALISGCTLHRLRAESALNRCSVSRGLCPLLFLCMHVLPDDGCYG